LWRPVLGALGGTAAMAVIVQIMVGTTRRRPQLVQLYLALLTYLIAPTIAVVIGGLIVAIVTGAWRP
jgi:hypothetical protein